MAAKPAPASSFSLDRLPRAGKIGVGVVFAALIGLLYFVVFYGDIDTQITSAVQAETNLKTQQQKAEVAKAEYQKDLDDKARREQASRDQKKLLPDDPEMPGFLSAMQGVATIAGVNLTSWSPTDEIVEDFYVKVPMKVTVTGKFHQITKFFYGVGQLDRIINVENIQIKNPKVVADEVDVQVECLATAFRTLRPGESPAKKKK